MKWAYLTNEQKAEVLDKLKSGNYLQKELANEFQISQGQVSTLKRNAHEVIDSNGGLLGNPLSKTLKKSTYEAIDKIMFDWFLYTRQRHHPINGPRIKDEALKVASNLKISEFKASNVGWKAGRTSIVFRSCPGEQYSADIIAINKCRSNEIEEIFSEYSPENVYNADESGIYYKMLPQKIFCLKTEVVRGQKIKKDRL